MGKMHFLIQWKRIGGESEFPQKENRKAGALEGGAEE